MTKRRRYKYKPLSRVGAACTRPQREVLELVALGTIMGAPPTYRELAACLGNSSTAAIQQKLRELAERGLVTRRRVGTARTVEVTALGWRELNWPSCGECGRFCIPRSDA